MRDMTQLERQIYQVLEEHFARTDGRITMREIANAINLKSWSRVQEAVTNMARAGIITKSQRNGRVLGINRTCPTCGHTLGDMHDRPESEAGAAADVGGAGATTVG